MKIDIDELQQFENGADMNIHQPCDMAGKNIENQNGDKKWIDIKGHAYDYSNDMWNKKNKTCNLTPVSLTNDEFDSFNSNNNQMSQNVSCNRMLVDKSKWKELSQLNDKLIDLSSKIKMDIGELIVEDAVLNKQIGNKRERIKRIY